MRTKSQSEFPGNPMVAGALSADKMAAQRRSLRRAWKGFAMEKVLCWISIVVPGALSLLFLLDMILGIPFGGQSITIDILCLLSGLTIVYLGWNAKKDLR